MILTTPRLILRPWEAGDAEALYQLAKSPEVGPDCGWNPHKDLEESKWVLKNLLMNSYTWAIVRKASGEVIGDISLMPFGTSSCATSSTEGEIGFWLGRDYWGNGYMPEACKELLRYGFSNKGLSRIWCAHHTENHKSARVQEKCGFTFHHELADHYSSQLDKHFDSIVNSMSREDWMNSKELPMNTIKIDKKQAQLVAHRGCSGLEQENTHAAFIAAGNRSYFGIECDVHKTVDGKYVIIHDDNTARVALDKLVVEESTYDTLRNLQLLQKDGVKGRTDIRIPSLQEYIDICQHYGKVAVLELKNHFEKAEVWEICDIIKEMGYLEKVIFISFDYENMVSLREKYPEQPAQFLDYKGEADLVDRLKAHNLDLDISHKVLTKELLDACHVEGIKVNVWTVDDPEVAARLIDWGVDFITTNILE